MYKNRNPISATILPLSVNVNRDALANEHGIPNG